MTFLRPAAAVAISLVVVLARAPQAQEITLPLKQNSVRFAVIGDNGTGDRQQYEVGNEMAAYHEKFPFTFVIMIGDNLYGSRASPGLREEVRAPYKALLDAKVEFYAALGNHDDPNQRFYKPFNMDGERYYTFKKGNVRFFALDSNYMDPAQLAWLEKELEAAAPTGRSAYFHHPLYSSGHARISGRPARRSSSRCSSNTASTSSSPATSTSTSASSRRRASITSSRGRAVSCARATSIATR